MPSIPTQERNRSIRATVLFPPFFPDSRPKTIPHGLSLDVFSQNAIGENAFENSLFRVILKGNNDRYRAFQI